MIIGCGEWGFRELPMEQHFEIASRFGFQYLEFGIGGGKVGRLPEQPSSGDIANFLALRTRYGIRTPFCCLENDFTQASDELQAAEVARVLPQIRTAADCGATHVRLFAGFTPIQQMDDRRWQRMFDAFAQCDELCQTLGTQIAIETHGALTVHADGSATHQQVDYRDVESTRGLLQTLRLFSQNLDSRPAS